ncbi:hypothetical protein Bca52824_033208 [Brassica carinata]|uniref:RING-type domain-containing protein n=1 Tax=Brassica carinata TaxID=52824 RepID=A0A8X7SEK6_BRACI|nr:hypothetical protein Bca52824_033208 [Brassica carinata]
MLSRRGRRSVSVSQLLQGKRAGLTLAPAADHTNNADADRERTRGCHPSSVALRLTETDPSRYGTPPARRDGVEALANVVILVPGMECSVCLDYFEMGTVGKQMPCNHSIHPHCLLMLGL